MASGSSSLSWADGISRAFEMTGQDDRHVIAVVGDGALTGGMTWEALNNISDKHYYESSTSAFQIQPGAPRSLVVTGTYSF